MNPHSRRFTTGELIILACSIASAVAFSIFPWLTVSGIDFSGFELLQQVQSSNQPGASLIFFILISIILAGVVGIWGVISPQKNRNPSLVALVAGLVGIAYFAIFLAESNLNPGESVRTVSTGFWISLIASIGLVLQVFVPRPVSSEKSLSASLRTISIILVVVGLFITGYLSYTKLTSTSVACVENAAFNCDAVTSSIYSKFPMGSQIDVAYLGFTLDVIILAVLLLEARVSFFKSYAVYLVFGLSLWAFLFHGYLTLMAITRIHALCIWCLSAHTVMTILLIISSIRLYRVLFPLDAELEA